MSNTIVIEAPASKSLSHRAVIAASLAVGTCRLTRVLESQDLSRTIDIMSRSGATITPKSPGGYTVEGTTVPAGGGDAPLELNVGESGTTCRLLTAVLAAGMGVFSLRGEGRMHDRPMGELTSTLSGLGASFTFLEKENYLPLNIFAAGLAGGQAEISMEESSQYLSGLLLAGPLSRNTLHVTVTGSKMVSWPYVGLTLQTLEDFQVRFEVQKLEQNQWKTVDWRNPGPVEPGRVRFTVWPSMYRARDLDVEGDWSNASYFLAAGAAGERPVTVRGLRKQSLQGDRAMLEIMEQMGADIRWDGGAVTVSPSLLRGVTVDMGASPDIVPTVAVLAAFAKSETVISNVAHLRIKESDRLDAVASQLSKAGTQVQALDDGLRIVPAPFKTGETLPMKTFGDHRIAMCLSILELAGLSIQLDDPSVVAKSFPGFWEQWEKVRA